ncbi:MAG: DUF4433 domain-containing protein [Phycisphaeraceae bacterium]|nr:DUF4433 domain-containing protein [Phycisphaeraceae bacterium]
MGVHDSATSDVFRLRDAVVAAERQYEQSKRRIADEWARMRSAAEVERRLVVKPDNLSILEDHVPNCLPRLRAQLDEARAVVEEAVTALRLAEATLADAAQVRAEALRRGIKGLCHFTRVTSLASIRSAGLLSRLACQSAGISFTTNDEERLDGLMDHISLSVSWPNWQLFYRFRMNTNTTNEDWCVLVLAPEIMWTRDCLFSADNAASTRESRRSFRDRQGVAAFNRMFDDSGGEALGIVRRELNLPDKMPTNHQAEVLMRGCVPWECVRYILVSSRDSEIRAQAALPSSDRAIIKIHSEYFNCRLDYRAWTNARRPRAVDEINDSDADITF